MSTSHFLSCCSTLSCSLSLTHTYAALTARFQFNFYRTNFTDIAVHFFFSAPYLFLIIKMSSVSLSVFPLTFLSVISFLFCPPQFIGELLREGAGLSVGVSVGAGQGGQWLARVRQAITDGLVPDVSVVPVGISYDRLPRCFIRPQVMTLIRTTCALARSHNDLYQA